MCLGRTHNADIGGRILVWVLQIVLDPHIWLQYANCLGY